MTKAILKNMKSEVGATAIEYGLIVAAVGAALAVVIFLCGASIQGTFTSILTVFAG